MYRAYKYRIYPNATQCKLIEQSFGVCRLVYNLGLGIKIEAWKNLQKNVTAFDLCYQLVDLKKEYDWIASVNSQALQASVRRIDAAFKNFFNGNGYPKFKNKSDKQSFQCPSNKREVDFEKGLLTIPKIKNIPIVISRKFNGKIKTVTISRTTTGKYYASILVDTMAELPKKVPVDPSKTIGLDLGIKDLMVTSSGIKVNNPSFLRKDLERLKLLQRRASRKVKKSANRKKANKKVAILHEKIRNRRIDYLHKLTTGLVGDNQATTFCMEDLAVSNMIKNHNLALAISDVSWAEFKRQMQYKCEWAGKNLIEIGRFEPSSKKCSSCGSINNLLTLDQREWLCAECGVLHDRDINAAKNIKQIGLSLTKSGRGTPEEPVGVVGNTRNIDGRNLKKMRPKKVTSSI